MSWTPRTAGRSTRRIPWLALTLAAAAHASQPPGVQDSTPLFDVVELGLPKGTYRAEALNRHRQVAGSFHPDTLFVWQDGAVVTLRLPGMLVSARAITADGLVLGAAHDKATDVTHAVLWRPATGSVQVLDPGIDVWPNDVDGNGLVVGLGDGGLEGFALDSVTGVYTPLRFGAPPPQVVGSAGATAVNVHGVAVGSEVVFQTHPAFPNDPPAWWEKPFLWSPATGMVELFVDPLGNSGRANDVDRQGRIVGSYLDAFFGQRPALWLDQGATLVDLGLPPTYPVAEATDVNVLGQVLVVAPNDVLGFTRAFLWDAGRYVDLTASLPPSAAWDVWTGEDLDARGEILAGVIPAGKDSPPEPLQAVVLVPRSRPASAGK